ncbi:hypothetical protein AOA80_06075 [Methanomassiliicoccales archaeon RumEn M1]|nr:hypothetical protein AOA80_06075 [Methanomassiliicoccales archaeon RumEn M1]
MARVRECPRCGAGVGPNDLQCWRCGEMINAQPPRPVPRGGRGHSRGQGCRSHQEAEGDRRAAQPH